MNPNHSPRPIAPTDASEAVLYGTQAQVNRAFKEWQQRRGDAKPAKRPASNRKAGQ